MNCDLYIFGSLVRGDITATSDIDVLAIPYGDFNKSDFPSGWSIYSKELIERYFCEGRLFAWHLFLESKPIHLVYPQSFISTLGKPKNYCSGLRDIEELAGLLDTALAELASNSKSTIFELGIVYTAIRDISMAASWTLLDKPNFSRHAPFLIPYPCPVSKNTYFSAMRARHNSTRGTIANFDVVSVSNEFLAAPLLQWIEKLKTQL